jgi:hypothetical protein
MSHAEARIAELERRVGILEDHIALYQALSTYGPSVDSMEFTHALALWTKDGVYDLGDGFPELDEGRGVHYLTGPEDIVRMLNGKSSRKYFEQGCAHIMTMPLLKIHGDRAIGLGYHRTYIHEAGGARLSRLTASRWEWERQESGGWKAVRRTHRLIDGREAGRALLRDTLLEIIEGAQPADLR